MDLRDRKFRHETNLYTFGRVLKSQEGSIGDPMLGSVPPSPAQPRTEFGADGFEYQGKEANQAMSGDMWVCKLKEGTQEGDPHTKRGFWGFQVNLQGSVWLR